MSHAAYSAHGRLMEFYASGSVGGKAALDATALRSGSTDMREIHAHHASYGTLRFSDLRERVHQGQLSAYSVEPEWMSRLAAITALQDLDHHGDVDFAIKALDLAIPQLAVDRVPYLQYLKLQAELLFHTRQYDRVSALLARHQGLQKPYYNYLTVDSTSPFMPDNPHSVAEAQWLTGFNRQFIDRGLTPVTLRSAHTVPFNRIRANADHLAVTEGPLVTVIMTTYQPVPADVIQSAESILRQTWRNLELLVIDDASGPESTEILDRLEALDHRVRVIRLDTNGGTYKARNIGIAQAKGQYITGQDADDWSHPERIETQVQDLEENPDLPGNQVYTVNMTEDLVRIRPGYLPYIPSAPTLMVRAHILRELGGYLPARKAADNELRGRVGAYAGTSVHHIKQPLIFMRILPDSLSRADFRAGWQHPARRTFWSAYKTWHQQSPPSQLALTNSTTPPVHVPPRFTTPPEASTLDVVFAADWCEYGALQADMLEEIAALRQSGHRVGIMHLDNALHVSKISRLLCQPVQELINAGHITSVLADESHHHISTVIVRAPEVLQFMPAGTAAFRVDQLMLVADNPPYHPTQNVWTYLPGECNAHAEHYFGTTGTWVAGTTVAYQQLAEHVPAALSESRFLTPFNTERWRPGRRMPRGTPVVGAWGGSHPIDWPEHPENAAALLPVDGSCDVRIYASTEHALTAMELPGRPAYWAEIPVTALDRPTYYRTVDAFVYYPRLLSEAPQRPVKEALSSGCLVILPPALRPTYGDAAVYAEPHDVAGIIHRYCADITEYHAQSNRAQRFAETVTAQEYVDFIHRLTLKVQPA